MAKKKTKKKAKSTGKKKKKVAKKKLVKAAKKKGVKKKAKKKKATSKRKKRKRKPSAKEIFKPPTRPTDEYFERFANSLDEVGLMRKVSLSKERVVPRNVSAVSILPNGDYEILLSDFEFRHVYRLCKKKLNSQRRIVESALNDEKIVKRLTYKTFGRISGLAVGFREKLGRIVAPLEYVIQVHVPCKKTDDHLSRANIRPFPKHVVKEYRNKKYRIPIKVIESCPAFAVGDRTILGTFTAPESDDGWVDNDSRVVGGEPIAPKALPRNWGTFGIKVPLKGNKFVGVTNAHVVKFKESNEITNPPGQEGAVFAKVEKWTFGNASRVLTADAASLGLNDADKVKDQVLGFPTGIKFLFLKDRITSSDFPLLKSGAGIQKRVEVTIRSRSFKTLKTEDGKFFEDLIRATGTNSIIKGGDSGSVLVAPILDVKNGTQNDNVANNRALLVVGLVFAKDRINDEIMYACHWENVVEKLGIKDKIKGNATRAFKNVTPWDKYEEWWQ